MRPRSFVVGDKSSPALSSIEAVYAFDDHVTTVDRNLGSIAPWVKPSHTQSLWALDEARIRIQIRSTEDPSDVHAVRLQLPGRECIAGKPRASRGA